MRFGSTRRSRLIACAAAGATIASALVGAPTALADSGSVVINEIMYNGPSSNPTLEFIELYNAGTADVDISGWAFNAGITLATADRTFSAGTVIPAGGYLVGASDLAAFQTQYGFEAGFSFAGSGLSNSGETVTLSEHLDNPQVDPPIVANVIDTVTYGDKGAWPVAPDGSGPSLELDDPSFDNSVAANWHSSQVPFGSPGAANSIPPLPVTEITRSPMSPLSTESVTISARSAAGSSLALTYKVMFGADVTLPMADDDASVGGAGDGVFSAVVPPAGQGELVRFKIAATRGAATGSYPVAGDSRPYDGYVVKDNDLDAAQLPVLQWFMDDAVYNDMLAHHRCDDFDVNATWVWNGQVLDGGFMHIKGHSTCDDAKAKWDVELPKGYTFDFGPNFNYPLKKFDLQSQAQPKAQIGWEVAKAAGFPALGYQNMRIQRNGNFHGIFGIIENYDGTYRKAHGYDDKAWYKVEWGGLRPFATQDALIASGDLDKKNPENTDFSDIFELEQKLNLKASPEKFAWMRANLDLPEIANETALITLQRQWDSGIYNYEVVKSPTTNRWQVLPWDLDLIYNNGADTKGDFIYPSTGGRMWKALWDMPDFRQMHFRRLRTLHDKFLVGDGLLQRWDQLTLPYLNDYALEKAKWGGAAISYQRGKFALGIQERRNMIAKHTNATEIPTSQAADASVVINEIMYQPTSGPEYVELYNPSSKAVDMTGWTLDGFAATNSAGTALVIPAGGYMIWSSNDAQLIASTGGDFIVGGQFSTSLNNDGETLSITDGAREVDTVTYSPSDPWPAAAAGAGPSLELTNPTLDNSLAASWQATINGGTPAKVNGYLAPVTTTLRAWNSPWKYLATGGDQGSAWRASTFDDSGWPLSAGSVGCRLAAAATDMGCTTKRITYYARTTVDVPAGNPITSATLTVKRDDGIVVYVNGVEVARSNMPTGTIGFLTRSTVAGSPTEQIPLSIPTSLLTTGTNTIAVEIHDASGWAGADMLLDAKLDIVR